MKPIFGENNILKTKFEIGVSEFGEHFFK